MHYATDFFNRFLEFAVSMNMREWALLSVIVVVAGFFCLRGFGSRRNY